MLGSRFSAPPRAIFRFARGAPNRVFAVVPAAAKAGVLLGHKKLDTTALCSQVATRTIREVTSPLEHLTPGERLPA